MDITEFKFNSTGEKIIVTINGSGADIDHVYLFNSKNYKDYNKAYDAINKIVITNMQTIEITLSDLQVSKFDNLYIIELQTNNGKRYTKGLLNEIDYHECILTDILKKTDNNKCLKDIKDVSLNPFIILRSLIDAVENNYINESIDIINSLNKYCSGNCKECNN